MRYVSSPLSSLKQCSRCICSVRALCEVNCSLHKSQSTHCSVPFGATLCSLGVTRAIGLQACEEAPLLSAKVPDAGVVPGVTRRDDSKSVSRHTRTGLDCLRLPPEARFMAMTASSADSAEAWLSVSIGVSIKLSSSSGASVTLALAPHRWDIPTSCIMGA